MMTREERPVESEDGIPATWYLIRTKRTKQVYPVCQYSMLLTPEITNTHIKVHYHLFAMQGIQPEEVPILKIIATPSSCTATCCYRRTSESADPRRRAVSTCWLLEDRVRGCALFDCVGADSSCAFVWRGILGANPAWLGGLGSACNRNYNPYYFLLPCQAKEKV